MRRHSDILCCTFPLPLFLMRIYCRYAWRIYRALLRICMANILGPLADTYRALLQMCMPNISGSSFLRFRMCRGFGGCVLSVKFPLDFFAFFRGKSRVSGGYIEEIFFFFWKTLHQKLESFCGFVKGFCRGVWRIYRALILRICIANVSGGFVRRMCWAFLWYTPDSFADMYGEYVGFFCGYIPVSFVDIYRSLLRIYTGLFCGYIPVSFADIYRSLLWIYTGLFCGYIPVSFADIYRSLLWIYTGLFCGYIPVSFADVYRSLLWIYTGLFCGCIPVSFVDIYGFVANVSDFF